MFTRPAVAALLVGLGLVTAACGSAPDGAPESSKSPGGILYDEGGNPVSSGDLPDPTAGEEGAGDPPASDAGVTGAGGSPDGGVSGGGGSGSPDSGTGPAADSGATPAPSPSPAPGTPGAALIAAEAVRELAVLKTSTYDHTTSVNESAGQFNFDCSGFVGYDLSKSLPDALGTLTAATTARPLAKDFEAFFAAIPTGGKTGRWHRVVRAADLVPGDVVAWLKPADVASSNTGHVLIVRLPVTPNPKRTDEWLVPITDSTSTPHGATDSRTPTGATGLGTGTIGLLVDGGGAPIGYRWTGGVSVHDELTTISLGHAQ